MLSYANTTAKVSFILLEYRDDHVPTLTIQLHRRSKTGLSAQVLLPGQRRGRGRLPVLLLRGPPLPAKRCAEQVGLRLGPAGERERHLARTRRGTKKRDASISGVKEERNLRSCIELERHASVCIYRVQCCLLRLRGLQLQLQLRREERELPGA